GLVEDPVNLSEATLDSPLGPLPPAVVAAVVDSHEDNDEQLGIEPLCEPQADFDLLLRGAPDLLSVDVPVVVERRPVIELERAEAAPQILHRRLWMHHVQLDPGRVES